MSNNTLIQVFLLLNDRGVLTQSTSLIYRLTVQDKRGLNLGAALRKQKVYIGGANTADVKSAIIFSGLGPLIQWYFDWLLFVHNIESSGREEYELNQIHHCQSMLIFITVWLHSVV